MRKTAAKTNKINRKPPPAKMPPHDSEREPEVQERQRHVHEAARNHPERKRFLSHPRPHTSSARHGIPRRRSGTDFGYFAVAGALVNVSRHLAPWHGSKEHKPS